MEFDKDNMEVLNAVFRNTPPPLSDENLTGAVETTKKHSKVKKKDSSLVYSNDLTEILKSPLTPEQKTKAICDKYMETLHANRKLMMANKIAEDRIMKLQQENEQCQKQRSKAVLTRSRLENLCRELQKLNKAQKEEMDLKLKLEEEKRKEMSATFQSAFAEMTTLTNQNTEKNTKMCEENLEMREKIKDVRERVALSEQQLEKVRQQAQLKIQLDEVKMTAMKMEMTAEKECLLKEKQHLLLKLTEYQGLISELQATEAGLRSQVSMYTEKYDDFENSLTKSNVLLAGYNEEMKKMSEKNVKLKKETNLWKHRWEKTHAALLEMATDKQSRDAEMGKLTHKLSSLQELCKAFQRERTELLGQLRVLNAKDSTIIRLNDDNSKIDNDNTEQVEKLSSDCQHHKDDMIHVQNSLIQQINQVEVENSVILSTAMQPHNLIECKTDQNELNTCSNIVPSVQSCDKNKTTKEEVALKCIDNEQRVDEINNRKRNDKEFDESNDKIERIKAVSNTLMQVNKFNDDNMIFKNESPTISQVNEPKITDKNTQCKKNNELYSENSIINDDDENFRAALNKIELENE